MLGVSFAVSLLSGTASAADLSAAPVVTPVAAPTSDWTFVVTPYLWATGMTGHVTPYTGASTVELHQSFSDVLEQLNFAGFINLWATNGSFGAYADIMYVDLSDQEATGPVNIPGFGVVDNIDVDVGSKLFNTALFGSVRLADTDRFKMDFLGGVRIYHVWTDIHVSAPTYGANYGAKTDFGWVDPAFGFLAQYKFNEKMGIIGQADVGGFSAGSDISWMALAAFRYDFTPRTSLSVGYKYQSIDYDHDGNVFDTVLQGPVAGVMFRF
ncbi:hypothetical protein TM49_03590 [Martelella endophytica]|uniref:Outer membrane protein beta-barrel domain-containing protein n=1 Tax=Martelella endophytica TaxID=1486262 RepID=A0A0D5LVE2_MAREN|nr:hypothetical protein TM49_03590 [Martelella endophytica]